MERLGGTIGVRLQKHACLGVVTEVLEIQFILFRDEIK